MNFKGAISSTAGEKSFIVVIWSVMNFWYLLACVLDLRTCSQQIMDWFDRGMIMLAREIAKEETCFILLTKEKSTDPT